MICKKVLILSGGNTSERQISLVSAKAVKNALEEDGYKVIIFDLSNGINHIKKLSQKVDVVFPLIHGKKGEDGTLYNLLRKFKKPFVGSDCEGTKIGFHKILFKRFLEKNNIPTSDWVGVKSKDDLIRFGFPSVLKAAQGGSSKEVAILKTDKDLNRKIIDKILSLDDQFLVEKYLKGIEVTVGVFNGKPLPVMEIRPPNGQWFDYQNKYSGETKEIPHAPSLTNKQWEQLQQIAIAIHCNLKLEPYSRTDFIFSDEKPYVLEVNPPCGVGLTPESLFPKAALAAGISFKELVNILVNNP